ncbi:hypothetical protein HDV62DRAFT_304418 [Trichoderma sp. SZMC 28011]
MVTDACVAIFRCLCLASGCHDSQRLPVPFCSLFSIHCSLYVMTVRFQNTKYTYSCIQASINPRGKTHKALVIQIVLGALARIPAQTSLTQHKVQNTRVPYTALHPDAHPRSTHSLPDLQLGK